MSPRLARLLLPAMLLALALPSVTSAHVGQGGPIQTVTQAVGPYELAVTFELPQATPAPLLLSITSGRDLAGATLELRAAPRGRSPDGPPAATIATVPGVPAVYKAEIALDRPGDWELEIRADGPAGTGAARIPFVVTPAPLPPYTLPLLVSVGGMFLLLAAGVGVAAAQQRSASPLLAGAGRVIGYGIFACAIASAIFGAQQALTPLQAAQPGAGDGAYGRPHVNVALRSDPALPVAGGSATLTLDLTDGGTGLPVDDLAPHHDALMHLVVIDESGASFAHLHPARVAPGSFQISFTPERPGRHTAYVEVERLDSGTQIIARDFVVGGEAGAAPEAPGLGLRSVGGLEVDVSSSLAAPAAGKQTTLTFSVRDGGAPVEDIQPWLGMAGHMVARSVDGAIYSHVHALGPMVPPGPQGDALRFGPDLRFVYTFPEPGRYHVWAQFRRAGEVITVPLVLDVAP